ncbi:MAG TPA: hypothetical protein VG870_15765 [Chitinophagaceae bacterium]|nr:hypothetical protein [Chitinophagaceae bacterium]
MKKVWIAVFLIAGLGARQSARAQDYKMALGVRLSSAQAVVNNSVSFKYFLNEKAAVEGLLSFGDPVAMGALFELHNPTGTPGLKWFYGGGGYVGFGGNTNLGAQGVVGLDYKFINLPLNLSLDWKPELNIISDINFEPATIGFTARFTFH